MAAARAGRSRRPAACALPAGTPASARRNAVSRAAAWVLAWLLALVALPVHAQTRAWLDRAQVGHGETATLNIQTDQSVSSIDYAPLQRQFDVGGQTVRRSYQRSNGRSTRTSL